MLKIHIIAVGCELLQGLTLNTNAVKIGQFFTNAGYQISSQSVVGDDISSIATTIQHAFLSADFLITTGGLGPTIDDVTKSALAKVFTSSATKLPNRIGQQAALLYKEKGKALLAFPGVPQELEGFLQQDLLALIAKLFPQEKKLFSQEICLGEKTEGELVSFLATLQEKDRDIQIGIYPQLGFLQLRFSLFAQTKQSAFKRLNFFQNAVKKAFFPYIYSTTKATIAETVHALFSENNQTLAFAESCTGGALAAKMTNIPGASAYFLGSLVVYSNAYKNHFLQVAPSILKTKGAVSIACVQEMTHYLQTQANANCVVSVSGIFGPTGGSLQKPVGTVAVGIAIPFEKPVYGYIRVPKVRSCAIEYTCNTVLFYLWRWLKQKIQPSLYELPIT